MNIEKNRSYYEGFADYRVDKLKYLEEAGVQLYPEHFKVSHTLEEAFSLPDDTENVSIAGRIISIRKMGKITFAHLQDIQGRLQIVLRENSLGEGYDFFHKTVDIGDFLGAHGTIFTTRTGERSLRVDEYVFLGKALRELPEKWHGLTDTELRYRQRYLDLVANEKSRRVFLMRSKMLSSIRHFLENKGFIEVETPVLTNQASGALATPFLTHHKALDIDVYLRIAPETYLKRLIVGGFNHVFEVSRCFRNEGVSPVHLQDFTMIEGYSAYFNYQDNMKLLRDMILHVLKELFGQTTVTIGEAEIDFGLDWPVVSFRELILKDTGLDIDQYADGPALLEAIKAKGIKLDHDHVATLGKGNLIDQLYKKVSRPHLISPVFLINHPIDLSPLARRNDDNPDIVDRFQLVVNGAEIINAYSELVDPIDQRKRLEEQSKLRLSGDEEAMPLDEDYLKAMEYGMPPISGWGIGVDRLLQVLLNLENIRDGVLFPLMRPLDSEN
ncbi:MAG: lysine--tRNA ligase [Firmicutes bacterium]|jgi:lysyl-tRNA synthetase class 2|nr:lysine--tRNA ligase [Bacillota bacterium]